MRSTKTCLAVAASALLIISLWCAMPASAATTDETPAVSSAPVSQPPDAVQPPAADQPTDQPEKKKRRLVLMPAFNDYFPSDSKTQDRFGSSWPSIGLSLAWRDRETDPQKIELRLDGMGTMNDDVTAYIYTAGIGISQRLSSSKDFSTYAGVSGNLYFGKVRSVPDNVNTGWKVTGGPGAFLGANIGSRLNIQASYYVIPSLGGFGLSGFNLSAHLVLF